MNHKNRLAKLETVQDKVEVFTWREIIGLARTHRKPVARFLAYVLGVLLIRSCS
jgi:hypothetical protein